MVFLVIPAKKYILKVNMKKKAIEKVVTHGCEIYSWLTTSFKVIDIVLVSLLLTFNMFQTFFSCFYF